MTATYDALKPALVWKLFAEIDRVPRMSGHEEAVMAMLEARAKSKGFGTKRDKVGNMLIKVPGSKGRETAPAVLIQGHVDMVCEKNAGTTHDFMKDPIVPRVKGEWVVADGTTLGADNAIGVALALAAAEDASVSHGPLEILLTVDEEVGLRGAQSVEPGFYSAKVGINLDSEDDTSVTISCAGMQETFLNFRSTRSAIPAGWTARELFVTGLKGGHSGIDIHKNHGNAIRILARAVLEAAAEFRVASVQGGDKRNAIAREARAVVTVPTAKLAAFEAAANAVVARIRTEEVAGIDEGLVLKISASSPADAWSAADSSRLLSLLAAIPHGVQAMSAAVAGLVETSSNLAVVRTEADSVRICCTSRSPVMSSLDAMALQHRALATLAGIVAEQGPRTPGWKPNPTSRVLGVVQESYRKVFGKAPDVRGIHAGLECGVLIEKTPGLDMISFGPDIHGAHSPEERVSVASVERIWKLLVDVLARL